MPALRRAVYACDPDLPLSGVTTMEAAVREASAVPARRAARVDPISALRYE